jgi:segregation and condensation protein B
MDNENPEETIFYQWDLREESTFELEGQLEQVDQNAWKIDTGLNEDTLCGAIETLIFINSKPLGIKDIQKNIGESVPVKLIYDSIKKLQEEYEQKHHGIRLAEIADGYQFRSKPTYSKFVEDLFRIKSITLSPLALEVLTIIAFKQPISKIEIDKMRGVDSGHLIRGLMDKRLVQVATKDQGAVKLSSYSTTNDFLETFGINSLDELPQMSELEELAEQQKGNAINEIKEVVKVEDKKRFFYDEIDEIDKLQNEIKSISTQTEFLKELKQEGKKKSAEGEESSEPKKTAFDLIEEFAFQADKVEEVIGEQATEPEAVSEERVEGPELAVVEESENCETSFSESEIDHLLDEAFGESEPESEDHLNIDLLATKDKLDQILDLDNTPPSGDKS